MEGERQRRRFTRGGPYNKSFEPTAASGVLGELVSVRWVMVSEIGRARAVSVTRRGVGLEASWLLSVGVGGGSIPGWAAFVYI